MLGEQVCTCTLHSKFKISLALRPSHKQADGKRGKKGRKGGRRKEGGRKEGEMEGGRKKKKEGGRLHLECSKMPKSRFGVRDFAAPASWIQTNLQVTGEGGRDHPQISVCPLPQAKSQVHPSVPARSADVGRPSQAWEPSPRSLSLASPWPYL